jgi:hypothetical protein
MLKRCLALASGVLLAASCGAEADRLGATPGQMESPSPPNELKARFEPKTYSEGDSMVMPVTFPDGTTAELVYASELHLSRMRVQPYSSGYGPGFARDFLILDKPVGEVIGGYDEAELLADYDDGHGGTVGFWRLPPRRGLPRVSVRLLDGARL